MEGEKNQIWLDKHKKQTALSDPMFWGWRAWVGGNRGMTVEADVGWHSGVHGAKTSM